MKFIKGDFTKTEATHIAHGCNAQGVMGSGAALAVRKKWPEVFEAYREGLVEFRKEHPDLNPLGQVFSKDVISDHVRPDGSHDIQCVMNIITQTNFGSDGKVYARYTAIAQGFIFAFQDGRLKKGDTISIPKIGSGLGGLFWAVAEMLLKELEEQYGFEFWVYEF